MKLGVATFLWDREELVPRIPLLGEEGIEFIEVWGSLLHFNYNDEEYVELVRNQLSKYKIKASSLHAPFAQELDLSSLNEGRRRRTILETKKAVSAFSRLEGSRVIILHPGTRFENEREKEERLGKLRRSLEEILRFSEEKGLKLAVENMPPGIIGESISDLLDLVRDFDSENLGICLDTSHARLTEGVVKVTKACGKNLLATHISDNFGERDDHFLPFEGNIDWEKFSEALKEIEYKGIFMFEVRPTREPREMLKEMKELWNNEFKEADEKKSYKD
jgi:sugar phosphate isomerase/epimerase